MKFCSSEAKIELFNKQLISRFERKVEKLVDIWNTAKWKMQAMGIAQLISKALHNLSCPIIPHQCPGNNYCRKLLQDKVLYNLYLLLYKMYCIFSYLIMRHLFDSMFGKMLVKQRHWHERNFLCKNTLCHFCRNNWDVLLDRGHFDTDRGMEWTFY